MKATQYDLCLSNESQEKAFEHWHAAQTHDHGTPISVDKARVRAINAALEDILTNRNKTVGTADVHAWTLMHLGFGEAVVSTERVNEHCLYEAGEPGTDAKRFNQPKKNPMLRVVSNGVYALADRVDRYAYQTTSHGNK